jgi:hypothetical protein
MTEETQPSETVTPQQQEAEAEALRLMGEAQAQAWSSTPVLDCDKQARQDEINRLSAKAHPSTTPASGPTQSVDLPTPMASGPSSIPLTPRPPGIPLDVQRSQLESAQEIAWSHSRPATRANAPRGEKPRGSLSSGGPMTEDDRILAVIIPIMSKCGRWSSGKAGRLSKRFRGHREAMETDFEPAWFEVGLLKPWRSDGNRSPRWTSPIFGSSPQNARKRTRHVEDVIRVP